MTRSMKSCSLTPFVFSLHTQELSPTATIIRYQVKSRGVKCKVRHRQTHVRRVDPKLKSFQARLEGHRRIGGERMRHCASALNLPGAVGSLARLV